MYIKKFNIVICQFKFLRKNECTVNSIILRYRLNVLRMVKYFGRYNGKEINSFVSNIRYKINRLFLIKRV